MRTPMPTTTFSRTLLITLALVSSHSDAEDYAQPLPESLPGITTISAEALAEKLVISKAMIVIDARVATGRRKGYIEGSLHLADVDTNCASLAKAIPHRDTATVFYCTSSKCGRSLNALKIAQSCDYRNVYWFRGGFEEWQNKGYPYVSANVSAR